NVLDFVAVMERCTIRESALILQRWFLSSSPGKPPVIEKRPMAISDNRPLNFRLAGIDPAHPYIGERGIAAATAQRCGIACYAGRGILSRRIAIPIHTERGNLVAYAGRSVDGKAPKYRFPPGFRKSVELFNLHSVASGVGHGRVFLVEGF